MVDAIALGLMLALGAGLYIGRAGSYIAAATCTWALNRRWTFNDTGRRPLLQWARFLAANAVGGAVNYGVYAIVVSQLAGVPRLASVSAVVPFFAVGVGSICGLAFNFILSRWLVFKRR